MSGKPTILVVGEFDRSEFVWVRDWLVRVDAVANVRHSKVLPVSQDARAEVSRQPLADPDLVIICHSWPDEFSSAEVTQVLGRWPLALWVCCYGAWCASDGRTRSIWPISVRVPVVEAENRLNHVWRVLTEQRGEPLPLTASRDEAFEFDHCVDRSLTPSDVRP